MTLNALNERVSLSSRISVLEVVERADSTELQLLLLLQRVGETSRGLVSSDTFHDVERARTAPFIQFAGEAGLDINDMLRQLLLLLLLGESTITAPCRVSHNPMKMPAEFSKLCYNMRHQCYTSDSLASDALEWHASKMRAYRFAWRRRHQSLERRDSQSLQVRFLECWSLAPISHSVPASVPRHQSKTSDAFPQHRCHQMGRA